MRLSIDITKEQHTKLKTAAALEGKSIKDFVLERAFDGSTDSQVLSALDEIIRERLESAIKGSISESTVSEIFDRAIKDYKG